jgi:hypothetical protein
MKTLCAALLTLAMPAAFAGLLVTESNGKPKVNGKVVITLAEIADGSQLEIPAGSHMVAVDLASGREFALSAGKYQVGANGPVKAGGAPVLAQALPAQNLPNVKLAAGHISQATMVMRSLDIGGVPMLVYPVHTAVASATPQLRWKGVDGADSYHLKLASPDGTVLFETNTKDTAYQVSDDKRLSPGERYVWRIEAKGGEGVLSDASASFTVLKDELLQQLAKLKPESGAPFSRWVLYAALLNQAGAGEDAKAIWKTLAKEHPGDAVLKTLAE